MAKNAPVSPTLPTIKKHHTVFPKSFEFPQLKKCSCDSSLVIGEWCAIILNCLMLAKPEEQKTQNCVTSIMQTIFYERNFCSNNIADLLKTYWNEVLKEYYTEVEYLTLKKNDVITINQSTFIGIAGLHRETRNHIGHYS